MRWKIVFITVSYVSLLISFSPNFGLPKGITPEEKSKRIAEYFAEPEILKLPSNYMRAVMVAYNDFQRKIKKYELSSSPFAASASKIDNYWITITRKQGDRSYRIWFQHKPFQGDLIKGGGAIYIIEDETFRLIEKEYTM